MWAAWFNKVVRRLLSILLLLTFLLPSFGAAMAAGVDSESQLPACCRRGGAHQCALTVAQREKLLGQRGPAWRAKREMCPCCPSTAVGAHVEVLAGPVDGGALVLPVGSHPRGVAQTRSMWRVARERSRGKRGPPVEASC